MLFLVLLTVLGLLSYSSAENVYGVVGDNVNFKWNLKQEALLVLFATSDKVGLGELFGGEFKSRNPYNDRLKFSHMDQETAILTLMSSIETDYNQNYTCETFFVDSSSIVAHNTLLKQRTDDASPGNRVEITEWCLFLPGLLYAMLANKGATQVMVWSLLVLLVLNASTAMADKLTNDNCSVTWQNTTSTINNNNKLFMKWEFITLQNVTEVQFRRYINSTTHETMATLTPVNKSFTSDDKRIQFNIFESQTLPGQNAMEIISNLTLLDTKYDYDILVKLESGCVQNGQPINGSEIRAQLPQPVTAVWNLTADHSEVIGHLGSSISMIWTYVSDQHPQYILFKKCIPSSKECKCIGKLKDGEIKNSSKTQVLRHQKSTNGSHVTGLVTLTLLNTTQQDYGAEYGLEMFNVSDVQSAYIEAKLYVINRSGIVSSQTLDIKLIIIMCSMFSLIIGWKS